MIEVEIQLYGAFRKYESQCQSPLFVTVDEPATVEKVKHALASYLTTRVPSFSDMQLIRDSAIADHRRVLSPEECLLGPCVLSILPPVCGG